MLQAFDAASGEPKRCVEMASWPRMERMIGTFGATRQPRPAGVLLRDALHGGPFRHLQ